ncbi:hypothetical protein ACQP1P_28000 [Dactylosporangium sp. CA-052675]|uniref:hypothetical protein n=1 Tax=Dactylosporangium sp. CA-052675 TaxID=3239927 RepID=UPI003D9242D7
MSLPLRPAPARREQPPVDHGPPLRSKVSGVLAAIACAACCALPPLVAAGVLTAAGAAILRQTLLAVSAGLAATGLGLWWRHRRRGARRPAAAASHGCADDCRC